MNSKRIDFISKCFDKKHNMIIFSYTLWASMHQKHSLESFNLNMIFVSFFFFLNPLASQSLFERYVTKLMTYSALFIKFNRLYPLSLISVHNNISDICYDIPYPWFHWYFIHWFTDIQWSVYSSDAVGKCKNLISPHILDFININIDISYLWVHWY